MNPTNITPLILTLDEGPNLGRVLDRLVWADRVIIIDSGSTDETLEIASGYSNVDVLYRKFDEHAKQWNFGLENVHTEWVLTLDADYVLSSELISEIQDLEEDKSVNGYAVPFRYCIHGKPLRGTLYPPRVALFRVSTGRYARDGHTQRVSVVGEVARLRNHAYHDDRKPLDRWLRNQASYARLEAHKLRVSNKFALGNVDRLRLKCWFVPMVTPLYCLVFKRLILDGREGIAYALQRTYAEILLALHLLEHSGTGTDIE